MPFYNPPAFRSQDIDALWATILAHPFATLVSNGPEGPLVSHLPLVGDRTSGSNGRLIGHLARGNGHWRLADLALPSLAIFHGPDAYVSPGWYPSKAEHHKVVPTWNYTAIYATGRLVIHDDRDWLADQVARVTDRQESGRAARWQVGDAPPDFIAAQLKGIVGLELVLTGLEGKFKLSQNRSEADREGVITGLAGEADAGSAGVRGQMLPRRDA